MGQKRSFWTKNRAKMIWFLPKSIFWWYWLFWAKEDVLNLKRSFWIKKSGQTELMFTKIDVFENKNRKHSRFGPKIGPNYSNPLYFPLIHTDHNGLECLILHISKCRALAEDFLRRWFSLFYHQILPTWLRSAIIEEKSAFWVQMTILIFHNKKQEWSVLLWKVRVTHHDDASVFFYRWLIGKSVQEWQSLFIFAFWFVFCQHYRYSVFDLCSTNI